MGRGFHFCGAVVAMVSKYHTFTAAATAMGTL
jgi:hypothetical protein